MEEGARPLSDIPAINRFLSYCRIRTVPSKTVVIHAGDLPDVLYYIVSGSVEVMIEDEEGNEMVLAYLNKGQFFGEMGLFYEQPTRSAWVRTRQQCELAEMTYPRFRQLAAESPGLVFELATQLATRLDRTNRKLGDLAFVDVTGRVAHAIMDLCSEPDAMTHPEGMQIKVSRQELSRLVGCSREMAGRVLKVLEDQGLLRATGKTIVVFGARPKMKTKPPLAAAAGRAGVMQNRRGGRRRRRRSRRRRGLERCRAKARPAASVALWLSLTSSLLDFCPHRRDRRGVVLRAEDRRARDERVGAGARDRADVVGLHAAVDLQPDVAPAGAMRSRAWRSLSSAVGMNFWPPKPGFTDMISTRSSLSIDVVEPVERRRRVEHQAGAAAVLADQLDACDRRARSPPGWKVIQVAPAFAKSGTMRSTGFTIRCTSIGAVTPCLRSASHTSGPIVRFGT